MKVIGNRYQVTGNTKIRSSRFVCLTILGILLCASLFAQEAEQQQAAKESVKISLDEAVEMAFQNNLSLESSRIELSTKKRASNYSWNQFIPSVTIAGAYSRENSKPEAQVLPLPPALGGPVSIGQAPQEMFMIPFSVSLNVSMAMFENMRRLKIDYESGLITHEKAKVQLERDVRKAYHSILLLQENISLLRLSFANVERQVQMAQANYNAGLAPELTLLQARVARENMRPMIEQAESGLKLSMAQFAMYLGVDYNTEFELIPVTENIEFTTMDLDEMISKASKNKPEVQELIQSIRMLKSVKMAQVYSLTPILSVGWGTTPTYLGDPAKDWRKPTPGSLTISLSLRLHSFLPFSQDFQAIKAIDDQIRVAEIGLTQLVTGAEIEAYNIVLELERMRVSAEAQAQTVTLAQQAYRLTEQAYQAGLQDYFQVQSAQQSLHQARVQMLEQQFNYLNGLIDLEYAIGVPFGTLSKGENK